MGAKGNRAAQGAFEKAGMCVCVGGGALVLREEAKGEALRFPGHPTS